MCTGASNPLPGQGQVNGGKAADTINTPAGATGTKAPAQKPRSLLRINSSQQAPSALQVDTMGQGA